MPPPHCRDHDRANESCPVMRRATHGRSRGAVDYAMLAGEASDASDENPRGPEGVSVIMLLHILAAPAPPVSLCQGGISLLRPFAGLRGSTEEFIGIREAMLRHQGHPQCLTCNTSTAEEMLRALQGRKALVDSPVRCSQGSSLVLHAEAVQIEPRKLATSFPDAKVSGAPPI